MLLARLPLRCANGSRLDGVDGRLRVFPVRVEDNKVRIAADVEALPR